MSFLSKIKAWTAEIGVRHAGSMYREENFPFSLLVHRVLSKVVVSDEIAECLKSIAEKGVVVYVLKNKSQLNSLIIRELSLRKGIPEPVYSHDVNMIIWQPFFRALRVISSHLTHWVMRKKTIQSQRMNHLEKLVREGNTVIVHLGGAEIFENPFVEETLKLLIEIQKSVSRPLIYVRN